MHRYNPSIENVQKARQKLASKAYGRYDFLSRLFPAEYLLVEKPREVVLDLALLLQVDLTEINCSSVSGWLRRYRLKHDIETAKRSTQPRLDKHLVTPSASLVTALPPDPYAFVPSTPKRATDKPLLQFLGPEEVSE